MRLRVYFYLYIGGGLMESISKGQPWNLAQLQHLHLFAPCGNFECCVIPQGHPFSLNHFTTSKRPGEAANAGATSSQGHPSSTNSQNQALVIGWL